MEWSRRSSSSLFSLDLSKYYRCPLSCCWTYAFDLYRNHSSHFEQHRVAFEEGAGRDDAHIEDPASPSGSVHTDDKKDDEKERV